MIPTELVCPECGNVFRIMRRVSRQKKLFHRKRIYCYCCKKVTNHIEVKDYDRFIATLEFKDKQELRPEERKVYQLVKKRSERK